MKKHQFKPIEATPVLYGEDAARILNEVKNEPSEQAIERLEFLSGILDEIWVRKTT